MSVTQSSLKSVNSAAMSPTPHYEQALERDLIDLRQQLRQMASLVLAALGDARRALRDRDRALAWQVVLADNRIDALEASIDRLCQEFLVRHMPAGAPLRFVISTIKVNSELERMGDYADAIAHRVVALHGTGPLPAAAGFELMFERAITTLSEAVDAFILGDEGRARRVMEMEEEVDKLNDQLFAELAHADRPERDLLHRFAALAILNRLERVADRAANIAEDVAWTVRGEVWRHQHRGEQRVLFVSPADSTLGPMAEAIARARAPLNLSFGAAGLEPAPLNPRMVAFAAAKGFEVHRPRPRSLADVGPIEDYYVVVTLSRDVDDRCPPLPYHAVQLCWDVVDPARIEADGGDNAAVHAAFESAWSELEVRVADLISAITARPAEGRPAEARQATTLPRS